MSRWMLLKQAAIASGHPEYRLRQWCIQKKIRFNKAGNRYIINLDWLDEDLARMAEENIRQPEHEVVYGRLRKIST